MTHTFGPQVIRVSHINALSFRCASLLDMRVGGREGRGNTRTFFGIVTEWTAPRPFFCLQLQHSGSSVIIWYFSVDSTPTGTTFQKYTMKSKKRELGAHSEFLSFKLL